MLSRRALLWLAMGAAGAAGWWTLRGRPEPIAGQVALVTGGSRGLGLLLARELARQGCRIAICARDERGLDRARLDLERRGARVLAVRCDVSRPDDVAGAVARIADHYGDIDILVNNASIIQVGPLEVMTLDDFREAMDVNFWGTVHATLAVLPRMRRRRAGRIVNITSIGGKVAVPHLLPYDCAKFAAVGFSEGLRTELAKDGIRVTTVVPGLMRTGSPVNAFFKGRQGHEFAWFSIGDATPVTAMSAVRAARRIVDAARRGKAFVAMTWQARLLRLTHDLLPGVTADIAGAVNRLLPDAAGTGAAGARNVRGMELATPLSPSRLTGLMNRAAREYNQYGGEPVPTAEHARRVGLGSGARDAGAG